MTAFYFEESGWKSTEAIITAIAYEEDSKFYKLSLLGLDKDGHNYTDSGIAWLDDDDFDELLKSGNLKSQYEIIGRKIKLVPNYEILGGKDKGDIYEKEE